MKVRNRKTRRQLLLNVFCSTGQGGGVDPTCSPSSGGKVAFDLGATNPEIEKAKERGFKLTTVKMTPEQVKTYQEGFEEYRDDSFSGPKLDRLDKIKDKLPPIIVGGDHKEWWVHDGAHRLMLAAHHGVTEIPAYMKTRRGVNNSFTVNPFVSESQRRACYAKDDPDWDCSEWQSKTKEQGKKLPARKRKKPTTNKATSKITTRKKRARRSADITEPVNPLRVDPTRTTTLRRFFIGKLRQQFARLKGQIVKLVEVEDAFGLKERDPLSFNVFCPTGEGGGVDATCSPSSGESPGIEKAVPDLVKTFGADSINMEERTFISSGKEKFGFRLKHLPLSDIKVWETSGKVPSKELLETAKHHPEKIAPPIVYKYEGDEKYQLLEGHHRLKATELSGREKMWVCEVHKLPTVNVFCPTGEGGGIDATCSPSSGGSLAEHGGGDSLTGVIAPDLIEGLKAVGTTAAHLEHIASSYISDKVSQAVAKLPVPMQKVVNAAYVVGKVGVQSLFVTWKIKQALAERVAQERGASPEQARRLRGVLSGIDLKTFEVFKFGTLGGIHAAHLPAIVTGTLPVATTAYLAYSTARNPLATVRAAGKMVKEGVKHVLRATAAPALPAEHPLMANVGSNYLTENADYDMALSLHDALAAHDYDDWYIALLSAALDEGKNLHDALTLASHIYEENPSPILTENYDPEQQRDEYGRWVQLGTDTNAVVGPGGRIKYEKETHKELVPEQRVAKEIVDAHTTALERFKALGISTKGMADIRILNYPGEGKGGAYATGTGLTHKHSEEDEKEYRKSYQVTIDRRKDGGVPYYAFQSMEDRMIHEVGHNIGRKLSPNDYKELERLYEKNAGEVSNLPSFYAQENSSEMWAESVLAVVKGYKFGGEKKQGYDKQDPEVENFVRSRLGLPLTTNTRWQFSSDPEKVRAFQKWLKEQMQSTVRGQTEEALWTRYIEDGFKKGAGRAFDDTRRLKRPDLYTDEAQQSLRDFYAGTKDEFLKSAFGQPVAREKVELLAGRSFDDLEGITDDMSLKMSRALTDGLVQGKSPHDIARDLTEQVDITRARAEAIARTEIIRAHAEGQLTAMEQLGVEEVGVAVEWSTTGDEKVCKLCQPLEGIVLKIDEARGLLPRHPNCRCAWVPANVGEDSEDQKDSKREIQSAIKESMEEGGGEGWGGEDADIDKERPESIFNIGRQVLTNIYDEELLEFSEFLANMNPNHDEAGRFAEGEGVGSHESLAAKVKDAYQKLYGPNRLKPGKERKALDKQYREDLKQLESHKRLGGKGDSVSVPLFPPSLPTSHVATPQEVSHLSSQISRIDKETSSHNFVHLGDLRAAHTEWSKEKFDSVIQKARSEGKVSLSGAEGRHGISDKDREVAIHEPGLTEGHTRPLLYASLTENADNGGGERDNCGTGAGGFQPGNTCGGSKGGSALGGSGKKILDVMKGKDKGISLKQLKKVSGLGDKEFTEGMQSLIASGHIQDSSRGGTVLYKLTSVRGTGATISHAQMKQAILERVRQHGGFDIPTIHEWFPGVHHEKVNQAIKEVRKEHSSEMNLQATSDWRNFTPEEHGRLIKGVGPSGGEEKFGYLEMKENPGTHYRDDSGNRPSGHPVLPPVTTQG